MVIFIAWTVFILLEKKISLCLNEKYVDFCEIVISSEKDDILEFNKYMKSDKIPYISYADMECLIRKISGCASNSESSSTKKK